MPVFLISTLLHAYVGWRLLPALAGSSLALAVLATVLVASALLMPLGFLARRIARRPLADALAWAGLLCMGLFSSLFVLTLLRDAVLLLATLVVAISDAPLPLVSLSVASAWTVAVAALLITLWGLINARRTAAVVAVDVPIAGLPPALHGFTIAQISDIHIGPTINTSLRSIG